MKNRLYKYLLLSVLALSLLGCSNKEEPTSTEIEETVLIQEEVQQESLPNKEVVSSTTSEEEIPEEITEEAPVEVTEKMSLHSFQGKEIGIIENLNNVEYIIYENGASCCILSNDYTLLSEVEYEGNIYPVNMLNGACVEGEEYIVPEHIRLIESFWGTQVKNIIIPDSVEYIYMHRTFEELTCLETVTFPENIQCVYEYDDDFDYPIEAHDTFSECSNLKEVILPEGIEVLEGTFFLCTNLEKVTLPNTITEINENAFGECVKLTDINIPNSVGRIYHDAFINCRSLTSISLPPNLYDIHVDAFCGCMFSEFIIPDSTEPLMIQGYFMDMPNLKTVVFPKYGHGIQTLEGTNCPIETVYLSDGDAPINILIELPDTLKTMYVVEEFLLDDYKEDFPDLEILLRE